MNQTNLKRLNVIDDRAVLYIKNFKILKVAYHMLNILDDTSEKYLLHIHCNNFLNDSTLKATNSYYNVISKVIGYEWCWEKFE